LVDQERKNRVGFDTWFWHAIQIAQDSASDCIVEGAADRGSDPPDKDTLPHTNFGIRTLFLTQTSKH